MFSLILVVIVSLTRKNFIEGGFSRALSSSLIEWHALGCGGPFVLADDEQSNNHGFNKPTATYKQDPSLENYLRLRASYPSEEIEVAVIGGIDQLFPMQEELERYGFDPRCVASAMDADERALALLSLQIMEKLVEADKLSNAGQTQLTRRGLVVPDKLVDWLICVMLDALSWNDNLFIPRELIVLIRERLGGSNRYYGQIARAAQLRSSAAVLGGQFLARGIKPTYKMIGDALGVAPSTVMRWFPDGEFEREIQRWADLHDEEGNLRPLFDQD